VHVTLHLGKAALATEAHACKLFGLTHVLHTSDDACSVRQALQGMYGCKSRLGVTSILMKEIC